jgi:outer membrane protein OmpA-like peptidoglycan-associated protein
MRRLAAVSASLLVAACATAPRATNELVSARATYRAAAATPQVQARAPVELQLAERALGEAERLQKADADPTMVAHFAYLTEQRARIALKTAELRDAEAALATAGEQRSRMQLALSARDGEQALAQKRDADLQKQAQLAAEQAAAEKRASEERASQLSSEVSRLQGELKARETDRGTVLTLGNDVLFDSGAAVLKPGGRKAVDNLAALLQKQPGRGIQLEGFTDSTGSAETNRRLSEARAEAVKQVLVERGIDPKRIETRGYGQAFPVASNETAVGRQLNRRVEVVIASPASASSGSGPAPAPSGSRGSTAPAPAR